MDKRKAIPVQTWTALRVSGGWWSKNF